LKIPAVTGTSENDFLEPFVFLALTLLAIFVVGVTITSLVESYDGLYNWFSTHGVTGWKADFAPIMIDSFSIIGELAVFSGLVRRWDWKTRVLAWFAIVLGLGASVAGNVGDVASHPITWELTAAVAPVAAAFGITIGLGVLKRVARDRSEAAALAVELVAKPVLTQQQVSDQLMKDNIELIRKLDLAQSPVPETHVSPTFNPVVTEKPDMRQPASPDRDRKGIDVLIPPSPRPLTEIGGTPYLRNTGAFQTAPAFQD
jgi:Protein of unknown function (DUF2637)